MLRYLYIDINVKPYVTTFLLFLCLYDGIRIRVGESRCIYDMACSDAPSSEMIRQERDAGGEKPG